MISSVSPGSGVSDVPRDSERLHFVRPVGAKVLAGILARCGGLRSVSMSRSCLGRMPKKSLGLLKQRSVSVEVVSRRGRPISVPLKKMQHALELRRDFQSLREVERVTGISKSTVHYLEKYARRAKLKNGKRVIYLK